MFPCGFAFFLFPLQDTNYYFDVNAGHLDGALEIFSRFFVDPLFTESATGRELTAIDNENSKNLNSDPWRIVQVFVFVDAIYAKGIEGGGGVLLMFWVR